MTKGEFSERKMESRLAIDEKQTHAMSSSGLFQVTDQGDDLNERQLKILTCLIDYEFRDGFEGEMNNTKHQKMTEIGDRTELRRSNRSRATPFNDQTGQLKETHQYLNGLYWLKGGSTESDPRTKNGGVTFCGQDQLDQTKCGNCRFYRLTAS